MNIHSQIPPVKRCASFHAGHEVHWIQALWGKDDPETGEGSASIDSEGRIAIRLDNGRTERRWNHDPTRLGKALEVYGSGVVLRTPSVLAGSCVLRHLTRRR